jgi:hypothetical protein
MIVEFYESLNRLGFQVIQPRFVGKMKKKTVFVRKVRKGVIKSSGTFSSRSEIYKSRAVEWV